MKKEYGIHGWLPGESIPELISGIYQPVGIEIGTHLGHTTEYLLDVNPMLILHGVEPYSAYTDWNNVRYSEEVKEKEYQDLLKLIDHNAARYTHHRKTSDDAVSDFEDDSFDFIFIDGIHTYEQVIKDCHNYYPKLREGGLFCGHDMTAIAGVGKAVREFTASIGKQISLAKQDVWYFYK